MKNKTEENVLEKKEFKNFLEKKIVRLAPINNEVISGIQYESLPEGFIWEASSRSLDCGRDKNGFVKKVFDNTDKFYTAEYPDEKLTELEYMCRKTGEKFDDIKFWTGHMDPVNPSNNVKKYVALFAPKGELLDLSNIQHLIKYRIAKNHEGKYFSPSWEKRYEKPSYWYAIVDEKVQTDRTTEAIELKIKATTEFSKISGSRELLAEFIIVMGGDEIPSSNTDTKYLYNRVWEVCEKNPSLFLSIVTDPNRDTKLLIFKAQKAGVLRKYGKEYRTLADIPLGTLAETIGYLNNPENYEFLEKLKNQVDLNSKTII